jgi:hypothetical protein
MVQRSRGNRWAIFLVGLTTQVVFSATFLGLPAASLVLRDALELSTGGVALLLGGASIAVVLSEFPWGIAADRYGERRVLLVGVSGTMVTLCAVAVLSFSPQAPVWGIAALLFLAAAAGGAVTGPSGSAILGWFGEHRHGTLLSLRVAAVPAGGAIGTLAYAWLLSRWGPSPTFVFDPPRRETTTDRLSIDVDKVPPGAAKGQRVAGCVKRPPPRRHSVSGPDIRGNHPRRPTPTSTLGGRRGRSWHATPGRSAPRRHRCRDRHLLVDEQVVRRTGTCTDASRDTRAVCVRAITCVARVAYRCCHRRRCELRLARSTFCADRPPRWAQERRLRPRVEQRGNVARSIHPSGCRGGSCGSLELGRCSAATGCSPRAACSPSFPPACRSHSAGRALSGG